MENKIYLNVVQYIKEEVRQDRLRVGNKLPTEREMSAQLGISRNSIREALRTLGSLGIVESRQGSGNYLCGDVSKFFTESFEMMAMVNKVKPLEISQMRRALEIQAFSQILDKVTSEDIKQLEETLDLLAVTPGQEQSALDLHFHYQLIELSGNTLMMSTSQALSATFLTNVSNNLRELHSEQKAITTKSHYDIVKALSDRNMVSGIRAINVHYDVVDEQIREINPSR